MLLAPAYSIETQLCVELNADGTMCLFNTLFTSFPFRTFAVPDCKVSFLVWEQPLHLTNVRASSFSNSLTFFS